MFTSRTWTRIRQTVVPGRQNTIISTAATTTVCGPPAAGWNRDFKTLVVRNTDAVNPVSIQVNHTDGTTVVTLISLSLLAQYSLEWTDKSTWSLVDPTGRRSGAR